MSKDGSPLDQRLIEAAWHLSQSNHPASAAAVREAHDELAARTEYAGELAKAARRVLNAGLLDPNYFVDREVTAARIEHNAARLALEAALAKNPHAVADTSKPSLRDVLENLAEDSGSAAAAGTDERTVLTGRLIAALQGEADPGGETVVGLLQDAVTILRGAGGGPLADRLWAVAWTLDSILNDHASPGGRAIPHYVPGAMYVPAAAPEPPRGEDRSALDLELIEAAHEARSALGKVVQGLDDARAAHHAYARLDAALGGGYTLPQTGRDWTEDFAHENGNYECSCVNCGNSFRGHKRRCVCKACATTPET